MDLDVILGRRRRRLDRSPSRRIDAARDLVAGRRRRRARRRQREAAVALGRRRRTERELAGSPRAAVAQRVALHLRGCTMR